MRQKPGFYEIKLWHDVAQHWASLWWSLSESTYPPTHPPTGTPNPYDKYVPNLVHQIEMITWKIEYSAVACYWKTLVMNTTNHLKLVSTALGNAVYSSAHK